MWRRWWLRTAGDELQLVESTVARADDRARALRPEAGVSAFEQAAFGLAEEDLRAALVGRAAELPAEGPGTADLSRTSTRELARSAPLR